jgi:hypothetical protein
MALTWSGRAEWLSDPSSTNDGVTNPYYRIWMYKGEWENAISTPMPDNWNINLSVDWSPQFANLFQDMTGSIGEKIANIGSAMGYRPQNKTLSANIWQGTSPMDVTIPFVFKVERDVNSELLKPIRNIMKWALPSETTAMGFGVGMSAPYSPPLFFGDNGNGLTGSPKTAAQINSPVTVQFGNFFRLERCVIMSVSKTYDSMFDANGKPLSAKVDVSVRSVYAVTVEDVDPMFQLTDRNIEAGKPK